MSQNRESQRGAAGDSRILAHGRRILRVEGNVVDANLKGTGTGEMHFRRSETAPQHHAF
jgi:hypothetical protein